MRPLCAVTFWNATGRGSDDGSSVTRWDAQGQEKSEAGIQPEGIFRVMFRPPLT